LFQIKFITRGCLIMSSDESDSNIVVPPGQKLDKIKIARGFGMAYLTPTTGSLEQSELETRFQNLKTELKQLGCTHFCIKKWKGHTIFYTPWIPGEPSQEWFNVVDKYCFRKAKSCESEPEGDLYVYSREDDDYLLTGRVRDY
jgi:hypothetical protein